MADADVSRVLEAGAAPTIAAGGGAVAGYDVGAATAAASGLKSEASELSRLVALFRTDNAERQGSRPEATRAGKPRVPVARSQPKPVSIARTGRSGAAVAAKEWEEF